MSSDSQSKKPKSVEDVFNDSSIRDKHGKGKKAKKKFINDVEVMTVDPNTGGAKGSKLSQIGFIDPVALYELGKVAGMGIQKYDKYNYLHGYDWSLSYNAMMRHLQQFWSGEDYDHESGLLHVVHAAWHGLALASFQIREIGNDDRFKG